MNVKCMYRIDVSMCPFLAYITSHCCHAARLTGSVLGGRTELSDQSTRILFSVDAKHSVYFVA